MLLTRRLRIAVYAVAVTGPPIMYAGSRIRRLEKEYPPLSPDLCSTPAFRTPREEGRHTPHVDIYGIRIPLSSLLASAKHSGQLGKPANSRGELSLEELWARSFLSSRMMRWEGIAVNGGALSPDDVGEHGFKPGQPLLGGLMHVLRAPSPGSPLLVEWRVPPQITRMFERLAAWGYPWRLMDGGRHEWNVKMVEGGEVEVRFASAHDYKVVQGEGPEGKVVPLWVQRLHRAYARFLLDETVKHIRAQTAEKIL